jgi:hypothetical protein
LAKIICDFPAVHLPIVRGSALANPFFSSHNPKICQTPAKLAIRAGHNPRYFNSVVR